jgi:molybdate transport system substrate-binding protein
MKIPVAMSLLLLSLVVSEAKADLLVSCCMSVKMPLRRIVQEYEQKTETTIRINSASSGRLALQIEKGAPVDLFISASTFWMNHLEKKESVDPTTRVDFLTNSLILAAPKDSPLSSLEDLGKAYRIVIGDYRFAPFGRYAKETLEAIGMWKEIQEHLILANNSSQAITWLITGNVDAGFVYYSDYAAFKNQLKPVTLIPPSLHSPIHYWVAVVKNSPHKRDAISLERFLCSPKATLVFQEHGFSVPPDRRCP